MSTALSTREGTAWITAAAAKAQDGHYALKRHCCQVAALAMLVIIVVSLPPRAAPFLPSVVLVGEGVVREGGGEGGGVGRVIGTTINITPIMPTAIPSAALSRVTTQPHPPIPSCHPRAPPD